MSGNPTFRASSPAACTSGDTLAVSTSRAMMYQTFTAPGPSIHRPRLREMHVRSHGPGHDPLPAGRADLRVRRHGTGGARPGAGDPPIPHDDDRVAERCPPGPVLERRTD